MRLERVKKDENVIRCYTDQPEAWMIFAHNMLK